MMSLVPDGLKYTKDHEWAKFEGAVATVGVTDHAQRELGDIVFVELPKVGAVVKSGQSSGTIAEVNTALSADAGVINQDPYNTGWIIKVKVDKASDEGLMDAAAYKAL